MLKFALILSILIFVAHVRCAPQSIRTDDVEVSRDQTFNGANEAEIDYK